MSQSFIECSYNQLGKHPINASEGSSAEIALIFYNRKSPIKLKNFRETVR